MGKCAFTKIFRLVMSFSYISRHTSLGAFKKDKPSTEFTQCLGNFSMVRLEKLIWENTYTDLSIFTTDFPFYNLGDLNSVFGWNILPLYDSTVVNIYLGMKLSILLSQC